jgi:hypothetical protein
MLMVEGSDGGTLAICGRRPVQKAHEKARGGFLRAGFTISAIMSFCH